METSEILKSNKTYVVFEGVLSALLGLAILTWPGVTFATFTLFIGFFGIVRGIAMIIKGIVAEKGQSDRALCIVMGVLSLLFGVLVLNVPVAFATFATRLIAILIGAQGIYYLVSSFTTKESMGSKVLLFISGVISILFTFWAIWNPAAGAMALLFYLAVMLIFSGAAIIAVGISMPSKRK